MQSYPYTTKLLQAHRTRGINIYSVIGEMQGFQCSNMGFAPSPTIRNKEIIDPISLRLRVYLQRCSGHNALSADSTVVACKPSPLICLSDIINLSSANCAEAVNGRSDDVTSTGEGSWFEVLTGLFHRHKVCATAGPAPCKSTYPSLSRVAEIGKCDSDLK